MAPAEEISCDFMSYGSQSILVIKDRQSGFIAAKLCKDKTTKTAIEALKTWFYSFGFASVVRSDGGPTFKEAFSQELDKLGVKHVLSSSFNPQSNGAAERVVRSLREVLEKRGVKKTTQLEISEICFKVNSISQPSERGSAAERFLKRRPKTLHPASMEDHINQLEMVKKRYEHQLSLSKKKGKTSTDQFYGQADSVSKPAEKYSALLALIFF